jgi:hypothetical protein
MYSHRKNSIQKTSRNKKSKALGGEIISLEVARSDNLIAVSKAFLAQFQLEPSPRDLITKTMDCYDDDFDLSLDCNLNEKGMRSKSQDYLESLSTREIGMSQSFFLRQQLGIIARLESDVSDVLLSDEDKRETEIALDVEEENSSSEEEQSHGSLLLERMEDIILQPGNNNLDPVSVSLFEKKENIQSEQEGSELKPDNFSTPENEDVLSKPIEAVDPISFSLFDGAFNDADTTLSSQESFQIESDPFLPCAKKLTCSPEDSYAQYLKTHLLVRPSHPIRASLLQGTAASKMRLSTLPLHSKGSMASDSSPITFTPPRPRRNSNPTSNIVYSKQLSPQKRVSLPSLIPPSLSNTPQVSWHHLHVHIFE